MCVGRETEIIDMQNRRKYWITWQDLNYDANPRSFVFLLKQFELPSITWADYDDANGVEIPNKEDVNMNETNNIINSSIHIDSDTQKDNASYPGNTNTDSEQENE